MAQGRIVCICALALLIGLAGCSSPEETTPNPAAAGDAELDVEISGSVGDGPVVNANLVVHAKDGAVLDQTVSDQDAGYNLQLKTKGKYYPLTIDALGGTDLVTQLPPGFTLRSASTEPRKKAIVNLNPFTTLAVAMAGRMNGGLTSSNIASALDTVLNEFNLGLTSQLSLDPMTTPVDDSNLAEIVKASETLAEVLRRTRDSVSSVHDYTIDELIDAVAADLVDGTLDGAGGPGTDRYASAVLVVAAAQVTIEAMVNELRVNGQVATPLLDATIMQLASGSAAPLTDSRPVTSPMLATALRGVDAAIVIADSTELQTLRSALAGIPPGATPSAARQLLPAGSGAALDPAVTQVSAGTTSDVEAVLTGQAPAPPPPSPPPNTAPTISGTPPGTVLQDTAYSFTPTASDADGDPLVFMIASSPPWAAFDAATGALTGTPTAADVGTYTGITIGVSDGQAAAQLPVFSISVQAVALGSATLTWVAPTQNTDGSPLTDLAGYRISWGQQSGVYGSSVDVMNPGITSYVVDNLVPGTYYFVVKAINGQGTDSDFSNEATKTVN